MNSENINWGKDIMFPAFDAIRELFYTTVIATMPLWVLYLTFSFTKIDIVNGDIFYEVIKNGELFIYSATTLAPVIYIVGKERTEGIKFPGNILFTIFTIVIAIIASISIMYTAFSLPISGSWIGFSIILFIFSLIIMFVVLFLNNKLSLPDPSHIMRTQEEDFNNQVANRRRGL